MMDVNAKYKRWGWGALIGLAAVILIAGLIVAVTLSSNPSPSGEVAVTDSNEGVVVGDTDVDAQNNATENKDQKTEEENKNTEDSSASSENTAVVATPITSSDEMPKTGPENVLFSFVLMAIAGSLFAYNYQLVKNK